MNRALEYLKRVYICVSIYTFYAPRLKRTRFWKSLTMCVYIHVQAFVFGVKVILLMLCTKWVHANLCYGVELDECGPHPRDGHGGCVYEGDVDLMQFNENLEHLEADYFLWGGFGYGLDHIAPELAQGGPPPIDPQKANLDDITEKIIQEFGLQEVGHLRALKSTVGGFPRPLLNLSAENFGNLMNAAFGYHLDPPFNPYKNSYNYMLASYVVPYVGLVGYVGTNPNINGYCTKRLLAGLLGVEAGQDAVIRTWLYERANKVVKPYNYTVAEFTNRISMLRNRLAMCGLKDEGIIVPEELGAENRTSSNVLSADYNSLSYSRTPKEILRIIYSTGDEHVPGGFYPKGANGRIARKYLEES